MSQKDDPEGREGELIGLQIKLEQFHYFYQVAATPKLFKISGLEINMLLTHHQKSLIPTDSGYPQLLSSWKISHFSGFQEQERESLPALSPGGKTTGG